MLIGCVPDPFIQRSKDTGRIKDNIYQFHMQAITYERNVFDFFFHWRTTVVANIVGKLYTIADYSRDNFVVQPS